MYPSYPSMETLLEVLERLNKYFGPLQELEDEDEVFAVAHVASNAYTAEQQEDNDALEGNPMDPNESWKEGEVSRWNIPSYLCRTSENFNPITLNELFFLMLFLH